MKKWAVSLGALTAVLALSLNVVASDVRSKDGRRFVVDDGAITYAKGGNLMVNTKEMRATLESGRDRHVRVAFTYLGPTKEVSHLGNGQVRSQFGIKLRAQDTCNIVYIMWHFVPEQSINVSVKRNPGQRTHEECLDHGYINNIRPRVKATPKPMRADELHTLEAKLDGALLTVTADGIVVWQGDLGPVALEFDGPAGLRSDNAHVVFDYEATK